MSVECSVKDAIVFSPPFTRDGERTVTLTNTDTVSVGFKILANNTKGLCVRPNMGRIEVGGQVEVVVRLCALDAEPTPDTACRYKLKLRTVALTPALMQHHRDRTLWEHVSSEAVTELKLRLDYAWGVDAGEGSATPSLEEQLKQANAEIARLRALVASGPSSSGSKLSSHEKEMLRDDASGFSEGPPAYYECAQWDDTTPVYLEKDSKRDPEGASAKPQPTPGTETNGVFGRLSRLFMKKPGT